ncbi:hypothetical protein GCK32_018005, partial [Trichostrongylus colubriformis]
MMNALFADLAGSQFPRWVAHMLISIENNLEKYGNVEVLMTSLETNLADLNLKTSQLLSNCLTSGDLWLKIVDTNRNSIYYMSSDEIER